MAVAQRITAAAPAAIETLLRYGVRFDRTTTGALSLGLEAAHARRRIVHATGDGSTGRAIMRALSDAVRGTPSITVLEGLEARRLLVVDGAISGSGVLATSSSGTLLLPTGRVVIATGGVGGLFLHSTNPRGAFDQGLALAVRAGAVLVDMEFVQFHPTALDTDASPLTLASEAVRGEGATLRSPRPSATNSGAARRCRRDLLQSSAQPIGCSANAVAARSPALSQTATAIPNRTMA